LACKTNEEKGAAIMTNEQKEREALEQCFIEYEGDDRFSGAVFRIAEHHWNAGIAFARTHESKAVGLDEFDKLVEDWLFSKEFPGTTNFAKRLAAAGIITLIDGETK
jgi:hypothetical protein